MVDRGSHTRRRDDLAERESPRCGVDPVRLDVSLNLDVPASPGDTPATKNWDCFQLSVFVVVQFIDFTNGDCVALNGDFCTVRNRLRLNRVEGLLGQELETSSQKEMPRDAAR